jgi:hypothetical protein
MTANLKSKTDLKIIVTVGLLSSIYILNWVKLFHDESYKILFQSSRFIEYSFNTFIQNIFLLVLPISAYLLCLKSKISFNIILFYLSFEILWEISNILKFYTQTIYASQLFYTPLSLFIFALIILSFFYLLFNKLRIDLGVRKNEILLTLSTSLILVLLNYFSLSKFLFLIFTLILLIVIPVWDFRLFKNRNLESEKGISKSEFFRMKRRITMIPFLVLVPYFLIIQRLLIGPSHMLSDHMWGNSYHIPNKYYDFTMYLFLGLPAIIAHLWFYITSKSKLYLTQFAPNYYFTIVLNYFLIAILFFVFSLFSLLQN